MTFEQMIDKLKSSSPYELISDYTLLILGFSNLRDRLQNVEKSRVSDLSRMQKLETLTAEEKATLESLVKDRDDLQKRLAALEQKFNAYIEKQAHPPIDASSPPNPPAPSGIFMKTPSPIEAANAP